MEDDPVHAQLPVGVKVKVDGGDKMNDTIYKNNV